MSGCRGRTAAYDLRLEGLVARRLGQRAHDLQRFGQLLEAVVSVGTLELQLALVLRELEHVIEAT